MGTSVRWPVIHRPLASFPFARTIFCRQVNVGVKATVNDPVANIVYHDTAAPLVCGYDADLVLAANHTEARTALPVDKHLLLIEAIRMLC